MSDPLDQNRLAATHSPYLHQHADNPVNWQPWDETALSAAAERDKPIFLSVGYAACHWCHVMEEESFENESIAAILNDQYVPIKVDREERPDVDQIYQTICQMVSGGGGWPLSVWLTPDGRPFYVGTYFPPTPGRGRPGFANVLEQLHHSWENEREKIEERADQWREALRNELEVTDPHPGGELIEESAIESAADAAVRSADRVHGGFGEHGPKFPQPRRIELLLYRYATTGETQFREVAREALDAMADRGLYDHIGGGFHRYATDREWRIPHFEKMLYDNAELPRVYTIAYQLTEEERYRRVVEETIDFLNRELRHPDGGFYSTLDAQSEGREGTFYVFTPDEIRAILDDPDLAALFCERYGITESGNFERGTSVLARMQSIESLSEEYGLAPAAIRDRLEHAREAVFTAREDRERPRRDEKVLAAWNGLTISMLAEAALILDDGVTALAEDALSFVRTTHWNAEDNYLSRRHMDGSVGVPGKLDDYAAMARAGVDVHQATGELEPLAFAVELAREIRTRFWDPDAGTLYYTDNQEETLITRAQDLTDQSVPSSLGLALDALLSVEPFVPDESFDDIVETTLATHRDRMRAAPLQHPTLLRAAQRLRDGTVEITIAGDSIPTGWREFVAETYFTNRLLTRRPPTANGLEPWLDRMGIDEAPPIWAGRTADDGTTGYVCRDFSCSPPLTAASEAANWIDEFEVPAGE